MTVLAYIFNSVVQLYIIVLIVAVILSWLIAFGVVNRQNQLVATLDSICYSLTEPLLRPIRRFIPPVGGLDLSFIVLFIGVKAVQMAVNLYIFDPLLRAGFR